MGLGDWLMATGEIKALYAVRQVPVAVLGRQNRVMWSEVFDHNPKISRTINNVQHLLNGPGSRPYISARTDRKWTWRRNYNPQPGEVFLTNEEIDFGARFPGHILIEPNVKATNGHTNKAWPFERWQAVVDELRVPMVQTGGQGTTRWLRGVERIDTPTFRHALAVLAACKAFVGTEGALHHGAAALGVPAVVLWSEFISPDVTGYASHKNIRHAGDPCGSRVPCPSCAQSMAAISVEEVVDALGRMVL